MFKVIAYLVGIWVIMFVIIGLMLATSSGMNDIASQSATAIAASGNMSQMPGIQKAVESYPVWKWGLPVLIGIVLSGIVLYQNREELRRH